jgi:hypothetical protein
MQRRVSRFVSLSLAVISLAISGRAGAQACCAGSSAITPGRLGLHEGALVGLQLRASGLLGTYDRAGNYRASAQGTSELSFEQDLIATLRLLRRGQLAVLVPFVQTRRSVIGRSELGGGLGDVNVGLRYDVLDARRSAIIPGVALLAGLTLPTGVPVESADSPLATDATGVGAVQANAGVALEQIYGPWTASVAGLVAKRLSREVQDLDVALGAEWTVLAAGAYTFDSEVALAFSAAYRLEGDTSIDGVEQPDTARRLLTLTASSVLPLSDTVRLQGAAFLSPPGSSFGANHNALTGLSLMAVYAWP